jgi:Ser/Thr protein kinase RdoA (MazF antagonist)
VARPDSSLGVTVPAPITEAEAARSAGAAARRHGITAPIELLRSGANHVFRAGEAVLRVAPRSVDDSGQVVLARWLAAEGFPTTVPLADPDVVDGAQVTLWEYVPADGRPIDFAQLGEVVARLHRVAPARLNDVVALPFCGDAAWLAIDRRLAQAEAAGVVDAGGIDALTQVALALGDWQARARQEPLVVCHGDAHPQNVLMRGDEVVILDWDQICLGPAAWDHAALIPWADRFGGPVDAYPDFARGYGADLRDSQLANDLAVLRLLAATLNAIISAGGNPEHVAEATARMRYWLGDPAAPTWTAL